MQPSFLILLFDFNLGVLKLYCYMMNFTWLIFLWSFRCCERASLSWLSVGFSFLVPRIDLHYPRILINLPDVFAVVLVILNVSTFSVSSLLLIFA